MLDPDAGDRHTLSVSDPRFEISADGTLKLKDSETADYGKEPRIDLTVTATDRAGASYSETFYPQRTGRPQPSRTQSACAQSAHI